MQRTARSAARTNSEANGLELQALEDPLAWEPPEGDEVRRGALAALRCVADGHERLRLDAETEPAYRSN